MGIFAGKRALVVGGSGGIGAEVALRLAACGAELVVHGGHESGKFRALAARLADLSGCAVRTVVHDFCAEDFAQLERSELYDCARACDILCVCYGPFVQKPLDRTTPADWRALALLDYALPGALVSAALPGMAAARWGRVLLFGGTGTQHRTEFVTNAAYAGAKAAVGVLVQSVAAAYAHAGITCNAVLPGFTGTEYVQGTPAAEALAAKMPLGSLVAPASVAESALFLLSNPDVNGVLLRVDRGWSPAVVRAPQ